MIGITYSLFVPDPVQITIFEVGIYCSCLWLMSEKKKMIAANAREMCFLIWVSCIISKVEIYVKTIISLR